MGVPPPGAAAILLAAGLSARHPGDKLLTELHGRPLLDHAAGMLAAIPFAAHIAVVPPDSPRPARLANLGFRIVVNPDPAAGQGRSLRAGVEAAAAFSPAAILLALADMPFVPEAHIRALLAGLDPEDPMSLAYSAMDGARSPPAAFGAGWMADLLGADGDKGARPILRGAPDSAGIRVPAQWLADLDTQADFARAGAIPHAVTIA